MPSQLLCVKWKQGAHSWLLFLTYNKSFNEYPAGYSIHGWNFLASLSASFCLAYNRWHVVACYKSAHYFYSTTIFIGISTEKNYHHNNHERPQTLKRSSLLFGYLCLHVYVSFPILVLKVYWYFYLAFLPAETEFPSLLYLCAWTLLFLVDNFEARLKFYVRPLRPKLKTCCSGIPLN